MKTSLNSSGFLGGGQVGYNYEFPGHWVFGVEADIDASSIEGKVSADGSLTGTVSGTADIKAGSTLGYLGTARARLGYDWGRFMLFGAGGLAYGNVDSKFDVNVMSGSSTLFAATASKSSTRTGWTLGAGFEYVVSDNLTIRTEYLYADLGSYNLISTPFSIMGGSGNLKLDAATTVNVVRIGLNYKLD